MSIKFLVLGGGGNLGFWGGGGSADFIFMGADFSDKIQRAENGGLDPSWLDFAFSPDFQCPKVPKYLL